MYVLLYTLIGYVNSYFISLYKNFCKAKISFVYNYNLVYIYAALLVW